MPQNINNQIIGSKIVEVDSTSSTNTYANNLLTKNKPQEGTVILTDNQTQGRGQIGRNWYSSTGKSLTLSVILYPSFLPLQHQFYLSIAAALGVANTMKLFSTSKIQIKWPNDILLEGRKVSGILIQNNLHNKTINSSIIGIGINVNNSQFPEEIPNSDSLYLNTGMIHELDAVLNPLFFNLNKTYSLLKKGDFQQLKKDYYEYLFQLDQRAYFFNELKGKFEGMIVGITEEGKLKIKIDNKLESYSVGQIKYM